MEAWGVKEALWTRGITWNFDALGSAQTGKQALTSPYTGCSCGSGMDCYWHSTSSLNGGCCGGGSSTGLLGTAILIPHNWCLGLMPCSPCPRCTTVGHLVNVDVSQSKSFWFSSMRYNEMFLHFWTEFLHGTLTSWGITRKFYVLDKTLLESSWAPESGWRWGAGSGERERRGRERSLLPAPGTPSPWLLLL